MIAITLLALLALLVVGVPIGMAFGLAGFQFGAAKGIAMDALASIPYESVTSFPLLAIPLFLLMGELMKEGALASQLLNFMSRVVGRLRFATGYVVVGTCAFMGAITGSSVATVSAVGGLIKEPMLAKGYPIGYIGALSASAGLLGCLIPPSIPLIVYGATAGVSVSDLFLASLVPGLCYVLVFAGVHRLLAPRLCGPAGVPESDAASSSPAATPKASLANSAPALAMPIVVLGGIYGGIFTPTEAAAAGCAYALVFYLLRFGLRGKVLSSAFGKAAIASAAVISILAFASIFNRALTLMQVPTQFAEYALSLTTNPMMFLLLVNLVMLVVGMFMETNTAVLLMAPLLAPVASRYGIDPLHFGVILVTNIEVGLLTPPMAANIFVASNTTGAPMAAMLRYVWPFLAAAICMLFVVTYVPLLTIWPKLI
jgi:C4-dicarboxylate transporter, DctM subunit